MGMKLETVDIDEIIGSQLEAWLTRKTAPDRCRFCNEQKDSLKGDQVKDKFCSRKCLRDFDFAMRARLAFGARDMKRRGFD
jgi:hypothetical protein